MPRVTISEPDKTPQPYRFLLERRTINIGRGTDNDIVIDCGSVSTHHSIMKRVEGGYILRDNGSTNGIKKDGTQMEVIDLFDGIEVLVGDIPLGFELSEEEIETLSEEEFTSHQKKKLPKVKEPEETPTPKPKPAESSTPRSSVTPTPLASANPGMNPFMIMVLMLAAVIGGMALRHHQDHKKLIFSEAVEEQSSTNESDETTETSEDSDPE